MLAARRVLRSSASLIPPGNQFAFPSDFANAVWTPTNCTVSSNVAIAPDGSYTADKLVEDGTNSQKSITDGSVIVAGVRYFVQIYAKSLGQSRYLAVAGAGLVGAGECPVLNVDTGSVDPGGTSTIIQRQTNQYAPLVCNGWYRYSGLFTAANTSGFVFALVNDPTSNTAAAYLGNSASGVLIWGAYYRQA
jgi:hypothetical protein